jgi:hypothetical protein
VRDPSWPRPVGEGGGDDKEEEEREDNLTSGTHVEVRGI